MASLVPLGGAFPTVPPVNVLAGVQSTPAFRPSISPVSVTEMPNPASVPAAEPAVLLTVPEVQVVQVMIEAGLVRAPAVVRLAVRGQSDEVDLRQPRIVADFAREAIAVHVARQRDVQYIDAEVTRIRTRSPLPPDADIPRIIHTQQERLFMEESGLGEARPDAAIRFSRPQGYVELSDAVKVHGFHLMEEGGAVLSRGAIAADWYDRVHLPVVVAMHDAGLFELYPRALEGDLFLWVQQRRREF